MTSKVRQALLSGLFVALVALAAWQYGWLERWWECTTWDWRVRYYAKPSSASTHIKLILLDQASLDWGARSQQWSWPWPREAYAAVIDFARRGGAKVFVFDVITSEDSIYGMADDRILGQAMRAAGNVVSTLFLSAGHSGRATAWPNRMSVPPAPVEGLSSWLQAHSNTPWVMTRAAFPVAEVAGNSAGLGHVVGQPDHDAITRRANLFTQFDGHAVPSLGMAAYLLGHPVRSLRVQDSWLYIDHHPVPIDPHAQVILNYRGATAVYETYNVKEILQAEMSLRGGVDPAIDPAVFKDAYVLLGLSAPGLLDLRPTPLSAVAPGAMIHATLLDNLLSTDVLRDVPPPAVFAFTLALSVLAALAVRFGGNVGYTVLAFALFLPLPGLGAFLAYERGYWLPMVVLQLAIVVALTIGVIVDYATEGRERARIKGLFEHYLSPEVIQQLLNEPSRAKLGGIKRELSMMFTDLQGFSSISEDIKDPEKLIDLMNEYLSDMTEIILDELGTLDKYEGDAILAFWNAPVDQPDHAVRACRAALRCQRKLAERRQNLSKSYGLGNKQLYMRIGINSGEVIVGNLGSKQPFDYTMTGDNANLAARLEGANKEFGTYLMVAEDTWEQAKKKFIGREIATIRVVGRQTPVTVYELLDFKNQDGKNRPGYLDQYEAALCLYKQGKLREALQLFEQLRDDPVSQAYVKRCHEAFSITDGDWDPIWTLTSK